MSDAASGEGAVPVEGQGNDVTPTIETTQPPSPQATDTGQAPKKARPAVVVRYGLMKQIGLFRHNLRELPPIGSAVVVRTERGVERGLVVINVLSDGDGFGRITREQLNDFLKACGKEYPFRRDGKVLRMANHQDVVDYRHLSSSGHEEAVFCQEQLDELELPMKLVTVEHLLGGGRIIFYFSAESRVDFRELVRRLASQYHTRIEMRQVGARDEARLVADYERCGQRCCCQQFLQYLRPVSMRMAKTQKATLDPSKISGRCGRLMCCLRYEDIGYEELRKNLPRRNTWVRTEEVTGRVIDTQILTQLAKVVLVDGSTRAVSIGDIIERDLPAPAPQAEQPDRRRGHRKRDEAEDDGAKGKKDQPRAETPGEKGPDDDQSRKRRKRRRRSKGAGRPAPQAEAPTGQHAPTQAPVAAAPDGAGQQPPPPGQGAEGADQAKPVEGAPTRRRRRRRRKKKKSSGQGGS